MNAPLSLPLSLSLSLSLSRSLSLSLSLSRSLALSLSLSVFGLKDRALAPAQRFQGEILSKAFKKLVALISFGVRYRGAESLGLLSKISTKAQRAGVCR